MGMYIFAGDILDGYHPKDESIAALEELLEIFDALQKPHWHMIGNHCLYNLPREVSPPSPITMTIPHSPHVPPQDDVVSGALLMYELTKAEALGMRQRRSVHQACSWNRALLVTGAE